MKSQRFAAHRIYSEHDRFLRNGVLVLQNGVVSRIEPLTEEVPFTEWIGGVIMLSCKASLDVSMLPDYSLSSISHYLWNEKGLVEKPLYAWHFDMVDLAHERIMESSHIVRLN